MASKLQDGGAVGIYGDSQELAHPGIDKDTSWYTRLGWWIVVAGVGGFLLWASFAPLDKGVPISGTVTVASSRKAIQHLAGGTIEDILVKEGDVVKAGDGIGTHEQRAGQGQCRDDARSISCGARSRSAVDRRTRRKKADCFSGRAGKHEK